MEQSHQKRVLVVEDDAHIAEGLCLNLSLQGYDVKISPDGVAALQDWKEWKPDLIVLDIMLPEIDGISVLRNIRLEDERIPVLVLSAKSSPDDKVECFHYGVDDYLQKPFNLDEFLLRVERLLTRFSWSKEADDVEKFDEDSTETVYSFGDNRVDFSKATAICRQGKINLTEQEMKLLKLFISNRGKPLSRAKLLEIGWGYTSRTETRTIDNFIVRFRKYFEDDPKNPVFFKSLRAIGYIFNH
ncbi:response regulator transcription factor [bacterium]|nr:response regulator transcription factor [bacterium]